MNRSRRLKPLVDIAARHQDDAASALRRHQDELRHYQARLAEMRGYQQEYARQFQEMGRAGIHGDHLKGYRTFLANLDEAIRQLQGLIAMAGRQCDTSRAEWIARRSRYQALEKTVDRFRFLEDREELRREDRDSDDRTQRRPVNHES